MKISIGKVVKNIVREELFRKISEHKMLTEDQAKEVIDRIAKRIIMNKMLVEHIFDKQKNKEEVIQTVIVALEPLLQLVHTTDKTKIKQEINKSLKDHMPNTLEEIASYVNHCNRCGERITRKEEICFICRASEGTDFRRGYIVNTSVNTIEQDKKLIRAYILGGDRIDISDVQYDNCNMPLLVKLRESTY